MNDFLLALRSHSHQSIHRRIQPLSAQVMTTSNTAVPLPVFVGRQGSTLSRAPAWGTEVRRCNGAVNRSLSSRSTGSKNMRQSLPCVRLGWQSLVMLGVLLASTHCFLMITLITVSLTLCVRVGRHQETHCFLLASLSLCMREGRHQEAPFYLLTVESL